MALGLDLRQALMGGRLGAECWVSDALGRLLSALRLGWVVCKPPSASTGSRLATPGRQKQGAAGFVRIARGSIQYRHCALSSAASPGISSTLAAR